MDLPLFLAMTEYEKGCPQRIQHFIKVYTFASFIAEGEKVEESTRRRVGIAALVHDIGIQASIEKYGDGDGIHQQECGPPIAQALLTSLGYEKEIVERVTYLVSKHHTYTNIDGLDYQILVEADFLVNIYEGDMSKQATKAVESNIFRTSTGKTLLQRMFLAEGASCSL